jgi:hypothetical protein
LISWVRESISQSPYRTLPAPPFTKKRKKKAAGKLRLKMDFESGGGEAVGLCEVVY